MSAYVHFPFCRNICDFCGYETRLISKVSAQGFPQLAVNQILNDSKNNDFSTARLKAVFFGGGTASLMSQQGLATILRSIEDLAASSDGAEVTLECEPGTIGLEKLRAARAAGVNRVSVCAQALDNSVLKRIGRWHSHEQSMKLIDHCLAAGIERIHVDLMYGLPDQTLVEWRNTLEKVVKLPVHHISAYKLYIFRHGAMNRRNAVPRPEAESDKDTRRYMRMYDAASTILGRAGFRQYSLTEYARPECESVYIRSCFDGTDLLPIGPSAFGRCGREIWDNCPYVRMFGTPEAKRHDRALRLSPLEAFKRDVILGLWLLRVSVAELAQRHGVAVGYRLLRLLKTLCDRGRVEFDGDSIYLAAEQRFMAGEVMRQLDALNTEAWGSAPVHVSPVRPAVQGNGHVPLSGELRTILRMARRDPEFFDALNRTPVGTLSSLDHGLKGKELSDLCDVIAGGAESSERGIFQEIYALWTAVKAEHVGVTSLRRARRP